MKKYIPVLTATVLALILVPAQAQPAMRGSMGGGMGGAPSGPNLGGDMAKIFGENSAYTANLEIHSPSSLSDLTGSFSPRLSRNPLLGPIPRG
jgi:hypothetical protein